MLCKLTFLLLAFLCSVVCYASDREPFQVTFGVRPLQQRAAASDHAQFIQEAPNGDLFVAGNGGSVYTDTGNRTKPMIARINKSGVVVWKRIFDDLKNQEILAFAARGEDLYLVLKIDVRDPSGRTIKTETVSLHRIDGNGTKSRVLGTLEGVEIYGTAAVYETRLERFVLAGIDATGRTYRNYERRDVGLYELPLNGDFQRLPFQGGVTGLRYFSHIGGDSFVFLEMGTFYSAPKGIVVIDESGRTSMLVEGIDTQPFPEHVITHADRIFLVTSVGIPKQLTRVFAYSMSGEILWHRDFPMPKYKHIRAVAGLTSGGLAFSSSYENSPVITVLNSDGEVEWEKRFRSIKRMSSVGGIRELSDGWLALAGSTGPGGGGFVSTDSDAVVTLTGPEGEGLGRYSGCLVDAGEVEQLRTELTLLTGIEVRRAIAMDGGAPEPLENLPPMDEPIPPDFGCGSLSEKHLLLFLQDAVARAEQLGLSRPSDRAKIDVLLRPNDALRAPGYRERGWIDTGRVPLIEIEYGKAADAIDFIAEDILPYTERAWIVFDRLQSIGQMWIGKDRVSPRSFTPDLPFKEVIPAAEQLLERFDQLPVPDQKAFGTQFAGKPVVFSTNNQKLHVWSDLWLLVGKDRLGEAFEYVLRTVPGLDSEISAATSPVGQRLNLRVRRRPGLDREQYLGALRAIQSASEQLSEEDVALLKNIGASLTIGGADEFPFDIRFAEYNREIILTLEAAPLILQEIISNADRLLAQPVR